MKKIRYNIAENRKIDMGKFFLITGTIIGISLIFVFLGIGNLWSSDRQDQDREKKRQEDFRIIEKLTKRNIKNEAEIRAFKAKWAKEIGLCKTLVDSKLYSIIDRFNILEKHLPEGVSFHTVTLDSRRSNIISLEIEAQSLQHFQQTQKQFSAYRPSISKERDEDGFIRASMTLRLKSKKAPKVKKKKKKLKDTIDGMNI